MRKAGEPVVIYRAANTQQGNLLRNLLEEQGIAAWVQNDLIQAAAGELPLGWRGDCQVVVRDLDAEEARRLALDFERQLRHDIVDSSADESSDKSASEPWKDWPACPDCGERRHARCPICGLAGDQFPLADLEVTPQGQQVLLLCEECDEPFRPEFYRLCHRCGHDFGEGIRLASDGRVLSEYLPELDSRKAWLLTAGLAVIGGLLAAYFYFVLRG